MMTEKEITEKLLKLGCNRSQVPQVLHEVGMLISGKALEEYLKSFSVDDRARILSLQPDDLQTYLETHHDSLPPFSQEQFDAVHDQTWHEYFQAVR